MHVYISLSLYIYIYIIYIYVCVCVLDDPLPAHYKSKLKWKPSTITPNIVKHVISRVGFTFSNSE